MCNLGESIYEKGYKDGLKHAMKIAINNAMQNGMNFGIKALIESLRECNISDEIILYKIMQKYHLPEETARKYMS